VSSVHRLSAACSDAGRSRRAWPERPQQHCTLPFLCALQRDRADGRRVRPPAGRHAARRCGAALACVPHIRSPHVQPWHLRNVPAATTRLHSAAVRGVSGCTPCTAGSAVALHAGLRRAGCQSISRDQLSIFRCSADPDPICAVHAFVPCVQSCDLVVLRCARLHCCACVLQCAACLLPDTFLLPGAPASCGGQCLHHDRDRP
jgi:hypothetical protein